MSEYEKSIAAYDNLLLFRLAQRVALGVLALMTVIAAYAVREMWSNRYLHVFEPLPGVSYSPPTSGVLAGPIDIAEPLTFQMIARQDAFRYNASIPVASETGSPARPFAIPAMGGDNNARALDCLTAAVYYEAASESLAGQQAVAQVVLNRMRHPAFPHSVCGVVYSGASRRTGCQFTFTCDGSLARRPAAAGWARARSVAQAALNGHVATSVGLATHYHTLWVAPYWSASLVKVANIGAHTFYRWKGPSGSSGAFNSAYAGAEPVPSRGRADGAPAGDASATASQALIEPSALVLTEVDTVAGIDPGQGERPLDLAPPPPAPPPVAALTESAPPAPPRPVALDAERPRRRLARPSW